MFDNPASLCYDEGWYEKLPIVVVFCIIYGIILPGWIIWLFYRNRKNIWDPKFSARYGSLIKNYRDAYFWWDLMPMMKRAIFVVSAGFLLIAKNEVTLAYVTQFILLTYVAIEVSCSPFKRHHMMVISILLSFIELVILMSKGLVFKSPYISDDEKSNYGYLVIVFICVIIGIAIIRILLDYVFPLMQGRKSRSSMKRQLELLDKQFPEDVLASRVSLGEPRGDLRACARACHFFSTLLPFSLPQLYYHAFLIHHCIEKCRSYRLQSSEPCNLHMRKRKGVQGRKEPHLLLQKLLNFHYFLSSSLHLHYSYAF
jgi:hypothetical protein